MAEPFKTDTGKLRMDLIPPEAIFAAAEAYTFGLVKYPERNWEPGMKWGRYFGALMRHMWAWWWGEKADPESGLSHLSHALFCLMALVTYEARNVGEDDRPYSGVVDVDGSVGRVDRDSVQAGDPDGSR